MGMKALIVALGVVAMVYLGYKVVDSWHDESTLAEQEKAYKEAPIAQEVACDACGAVSPMEVSREQRRKFQVCPQCGQKLARPIVYFICGNPECNEQLVKIRNHVFGEDGFSASPDRLACPRCGRPEMIVPDELSFEDAKKIAEKTGQEFP